RQPIRYLIQHGLRCGNKVVWIPIHIVSLQEMAAVRLFYNEKDNRPGYGAARLPCARESVTEGYGRIAFPVSNITGEKSRPPLILIVLAPYSTTAFLFCEPVPTLYFSS
ncbi:MAG: hypothetical protein J6P98_02000, partial [Clostridia bacterium]|nr:hypothetical protein [Clostridia bacterium]